MDLLSIGDLEKISGISKRSLRHYDEIGLLVPSHRSEAGYRLYSQADLKRLHCILLYRSLGFGLGKISELLDMQDLESAKVLREQLRLVNEHRKRLAALEAKLEELIDYGDTQMADLDVFDGFDPDDYHIESFKKWGHTPQYAEARGKTREYTKADWDRIKREQDENYERLAALMKAGEKPDSEAVAELVNSIRQHISSYFYQCSRQAHVQLAEMYIADERFTAYFEAFEPGFTAYLRECIHASVDGGDAD